MSMTTPWIRTHARIGNHWDLLVGNVVFPGYRTAKEVLHLEARIRQFAKSMTWDEATAKAAEEEKGHRWQPLSRKQRTRTTEKPSRAPAPPAEKEPSPPAAPSPQLELRPEPEPVQAAGPAEQS